MSTNWVNDINLMHQKYGVHGWVKKATPFQLKKYLEFRLNFIKEEYDETREALITDDAEEIVDGLIDLCVVAIGTLDAFGVNSIDAWDAVLEANMAKEVGRKESRPNPLGLPDLIKPEGWTAPSHEGNHGIIPSSFDDAIFVAKMKCKIEGLDVDPSEVKSNWSSDERMDIIGQNGNDGDHYEKLEHPTEYQDGTKIDFEPTEDSSLLRQANNNWGGFFNVQPGPLKSAFETSTEGVLYQELITHRVKSTGMLTKETVTRRFSNDGNYHDTTNDQPIINIIDE